MVDEYLPKSSVQLKLVFGLGEGRVTSWKIEVQKVPNLGSFYSQRVQGSLDQHAIIQCCTPRVQVTV